MRTLVRAFPFMLLATLPAWADPLTFRSPRTPGSADAASAKAAASSAVPAAHPGAGKAACELVADPASTTYWLASKELDQWVPCEPGQAIDVRYLVNSIPDAAQAHFCAPQQPIARRATSSTELGHLRCSYAGQDLAAGRKSGNWEFKPLPAAVPHRLASLSEPIVGPARAASAPAAEAVGADRAAPPTKAGKSAKTSRAATAASAAKTAKPAKAASAASAP